MDTLSVAELVLRGLILVALLYVFFLCFKFIRGTFRWFRRLTIERVGEVVGTVEARSKQAAKAFQAGRSKTRL